MSKSARYRRWSDSVFGWTKLSRLYFAQPDEVQAQWVADILKQFDQQAKASDLSHNADPWLVAMALCERENLFIPPCVVVTDEKLKPNAQKIPNVCQTFGIEWTDGYGLIRREGWQYGRTSP